MSLRVYEGRLFSDGAGEIAYVSRRSRGPVAKIEFPSDWHEQRRGWITLGLGFGTIGVSFPWPWVSEDHGQCAGHTYGFSYIDDTVLVYYGKGKGTRDDPLKSFGMPWRWRFHSEGRLSELERHPYRYILRNGTVQERTAAIYAEERHYWRPWFPSRKTVRSIDVQFSDEVGERTGSWKGGTIGCGYEMKPGETPLQTLRRMERERKF